MDKKFLTNRTMRSWAVTVCRNERLELMAVGEGNNLMIIDSDFRDVVQLLYDFGPSARIWYGRMDMEQLHAILNGCDRIETCIWELINDSKWHAFADKSELANHVGFTLGVDPAEVEAVITRMSGSINSSGAVRNYVG